MNEHVHVLAGGSKRVEIGDVQLGEFFICLQVFNRANIGQAQRVAVAPVLAQDSADLTGGTGDIDVFLLGHIQLLNFSKFQVFA